MAGQDVQALVELIEQELLPHLELESVSPNDPVVVHHLPAPWKLVGAGNFAAVLYHPSHADLVVKIYAPGRPGFAEEAEVYERLGDHRAYSRCFHAGGHYLVMRRLSGTTIFDCLARGEPVPEQVIQDVDEALDYARSCGLHPHDVHGRNILVHEGRGYIADVSDFLDDGESTQWTDMKAAYYRFYVPVIQRLRLRVPYFVLNGVRFLHRNLRRQDRG